MKKAKILLGALSVLAVVGGALAFKAQKAFRGDLRCTDVYSAQCPISTFTINNGGVSSYCTDLDAPANTPCTFYTKVVFDQ